MARLFLILLVSSACVDGGELASSLEPVCSAGRYPYVGDIELPKMGGAAKPAPEAPVLTVAESGTVELDGLALGNDMEGPLRTSRERHAMLAKSVGEPAKDRIVVAAPPDLPASTLAPVLRALRAAGFTEVIALGEPDSSPPPPALPNAELAAELRSLADPSARAMRMAETLEGAIWLCPDLTAIFSALASADPGMRCELMAAGLREVGAVCLGDQDTLATVILLISVPERVTTFRTLALAPDESAGATWGELASGSRIGIQLSSGPILTTALPKEVIQRVIDQHKNQIRYCYEVELQRDQDLAGKIVVKWVIDATGAVATVNIVESTMPNPKVEKCIEAKVRTWKFPAPAGGGIVEVNYPFVFRTE